MVLVWKCGLAFPSTLLGTQCEDQYRQHPEPACLKSRMTKRTTKEGVSFNVASINPQICNRHRFKQQGCKLVRLVLAVRTGNTGGIGWNLEWFTIYMNYLGIQCIVGVFGMVGAPIGRGMLCTVFGALPLL